MTVSSAELARLSPGLERTAAAIEQILNAGLTTASDATCKTLAVTFQEAARLRLLRLGSTLRTTHDELSRFVNDDPRFSQSRLIFFLNRSWLLCRGIRQAVSADDQDQLAELLWDPPTRQVPSMAVVCLGVSKKIAAGAFCAFEFRLRSVEDGQPYTWSTVFPLKADTEIPAEGFLHLPQKQKFTAGVFLEGRVLHITNVAVTDSATPRLQLQDGSEVRSGEPFEQWEECLTWDVVAAADRLQQHQVSPFETDIELQEEVTFTDYTLQRPQAEDDEERHIFPLQWRDQTFDVIASRSIEGEATMTALKAQSRKKTHPPLFGLLHYASCRLVVQPLTLFDDGRPQYITISNKSVDRKALLAAINFR